EESVKEEIVELPEEPKEEKPFDKDQEKNIQGKKKRKAKIAEKEKQAELKRQEKEQRLGKREKQRLKKN
ncbi:hypothetical protein MBGDF03_00649, partial [Thermoplasmatales archaeon SCGC AB-540-F20]